MIDDTYNANPAGAKAALGSARTTAAAPGGKKVVVTPGMVELGPVQARENANFAASAGAVATQLLVVGRTNARSLLEGAPAPPACRPGRSATGPKRWPGFRPTSAPATPCLYENDLPDHYP